MITDVFDNGWIRLALAAVIGMAFVIQDEIFLGKIKESEKKCIYRAEAIHVVIKWTACLKK